MSGLEVYGSIISQPVGSVIAFCRLSEIPFVHRDVNLFSGEMMTEEYAKINPFQAMPAIVHDGYNLWESAAIVSYLADAFNVDNQWYPKDIKIRGRINAYLHWHHQGTRQPITSYLVAKLSGPKFLGWPALTEETEAPYKAKANEFLENLKFILSETRYVARTQTATIADIFAFSEVASGLHIPININEHQIIKEWFDEIAALPVIVEIHEAVIEVLKKINIS